MHRGGYKTTFLEASKWPVQGQKRLSAKNKATLSSWLCLCCIPAPCQTKLLLRDIIWKKAFILESDKCDVHLTADSVILSDANQKSHLVKSKEYD